MDAFIENTQWNQLIKAAKLIRASNGIKQGKILFASQIKYCMMGF